MIGGFLVKWIFICDMLKVIPPSDIQVRPFKAYKEWKFNEASGEIDVFEAKSSTYDDFSFASNYDVAKVSTWATGDLDVATFRNGDPIMQITNQTTWLTNGLTTGNRAPAWCYYGMSATDTSGLGKFYNRFAVNDPRGLAPIGYKLPTRNDFITLATVYDATTTTPALGNPSTEFADGNSAADAFTDIFGFGITGYIANNGTSNSSATLGFRHAADTILRVDTTPTYTFLDGFIINPSGYDYENNYGMKVRCIRYSADVYTFSKNALYHQLKSQFYNGNEDNPFMRFGNKSNEYNADVDSLNERYLSGSAKVISIPEAYIGEGIKKSSVEIIDNFRNITYNDDGYGNLITYDTEPAQFSKLDFGTTTTGGNLNFQSSIFGNVYSASLQVSALISGSLDLNASGIMPTYQNLTFLYNSNVSSASFTTLDLNTGIANSFSSSMYAPDNTGIRNLQGNVFYAQGLITFTKNPDKVFEGQWDLTYKSTKTIYEHEYLLVVKEGEFNISTNPSAIAVVGDDSYDFTDSQNRVVRVTNYPGVNYIRKKSILENGEVLDYRYTSSFNTSVVAGFEHYDESGSIDKSGSFLTPYITTIGLYDNNADLLAVAKFAQPIKIYPDIPINFIIRFDT